MCFACSHFFVVEWMTCVNLACLIASPLRGEAARRADEGGLEDMNNEKKLSEGEENRAVACLTDTGEFLSIKVELWL